MRKIPSLFQRNYDGDHLVRDEVVPGAEWALAGYAVPTRKFDGTCCLIRDGKLYKRYELKKGRTAPAGFEAAQEPDATTGDVPGWMPVGAGKEDQWHREAFASLSASDIEDYDGSTFELCGPKIQGNPEHRETHRLILHGNHPLPRALLHDYASIKAYLATHDIEGIVWHHPDGLLMVKIKARDFGITRMA